MLFKVSRKERGGSRLAKKGKREIQGVILALKS